MADDNMWEKSFSPEFEEPSFDSLLSHAPEQIGDCNAEVTNEVAGACPNTPITPTPNIPIPTTTNVVVKIPVVLAETSITIPVVAIIHLEKRASEIKRIGKQVFITQCHLIPGSVTTTPPFTGVLVISGFVKKNIEFATIRCSGKGVSSGRIEDTTVNVHFSCTTVVTFTIPPVLIPNTPPAEIETLKNFTSKCDVCADVSGSNVCERNFAQTEIFNEKVFCELVKADIFETDISLDAKADRCDPTKLTFQDLEEKMVVVLTLKLLQKQQVLVTAIAPPHP